MGPAGALRPCRACIAGSLFLLAAAAATRDACAATTSVGATYTGEAWVLADGVSQGSPSAYLDLLELRVSAAGWLAGRERSRAYASLLRANGGEFAGRYVHDIQGVSNIESLTTTRLFEAWLEVPVGEAGDLRAGLYNASSEFDANPASKVFLAPQHGTGTEFARSGVNGPSIYPVSGLALRYRYAAGNLRWLGAMVNGVPGDARQPASASIHLGDGALYLAELRWSLPGAELGAGAWYYTLRMQDAGDSPGSQPATWHDGNGGGYAMLAVPVAAAAGPLRKLEAFVRFGVADQRVYQTGRYIGAGLVATGVGRRRPADQIGIAVGLAVDGDRYRRRVAASEGAATRPEVAFELTYMSTFGGRFVLQPDLQCILHPGALENARTAWVAGLRFQVSLGSSGP